MEGVENVWNRLSDAGVCDLQWFFSLVRTEL